MERPGYRLIKQIVKQCCVLAILVLTIATGCATVEPWERGRLAKPHMALDPNPMQSALQGHTYSAREAASSGGSAYGGGCGCY